MWPDIEEVDEYESLPTDKVSTHLMAGAMAGIMEHCVMYPVDSVKTRMQSLKPNPKATYRNLFDAFYKIVRYEGIWRPVRGIKAVAGGAGPAHALYFASYEHMKKTFNGGSYTGANPLANGAAGSIATVFHDAIMNPAEVVKQRMQVYGSPYCNIMKCVQCVYRREGLRAFYRSYTTQLAMNIPFHASHFMVYEYTQESLNKEREYNPATHMVSGAIAGAVAAAVTTPLDVCKTLLNTQEQCVVDLRRTPIRGLVDSVKIVHQMNGLSGYFKGLQARVVFQMPATAIAWSVYEFFKYFITKTHAERTESPYIDTSVVTGSIRVPGHTALAASASSKVTDR